MLNLDAAVLQKDGRVISNSYQAVGEDGLLPKGDVVLNVEQLAVLEQVTGKKALYLTVAHSPELEQFPLQQLDAIFIEFEGFNDGRGYSFAALLRRQGYQGELRAVGDVFKDVLNYLKRCGFDSFVLKYGKDLEEAASGLHDFSHPYQASVAINHSSYQTGS